MPSKKTSTPRIPCSACNKTYLNINTLLSHIESEHPETPITITINIKRGRDVVFETGGGMLIKHIVEALALLGYDAAKSANEQRQGYIRETGDKFLSWVSIGRHDGAMLRVVSRDNAIDATLCYHSDIGIHPPSEILEAKKRIEARLGGILSVRISLR